MKPTWKSEDGRIRLYRTDCRDVVRSPGFHVDSVITDPPYGVALTQRTTKHSKRKASRNYEDDQNTTITEIIPRVAEWINAAKRAAVTPGIRLLQRYPIAADIGGVFSPNGAGQGPWGFTCYHPVLFYGSCPFLAKAKGGRPTMVRATHWNSDDVDHPCPKPIKFMQWMMERASDEDDVVADPFLGSGTCGIAAVRLGRAFIGVESNRDYFALAVERIKKAIRDHRGCFGIRSSMIREDGK